MNPDRYGWQLWGAVGLVLTAIAAVHSVLTSPTPPAPVPDKAAAKTTPTPTVEPSLSVRDADLSH